MAKKDGIHQMSNKYVIVCTFYFTCIAVITILGRTDGTVTNSWDKVFLHMKYNRKERW